MATAHPSASGRSGWRRLQIVGKRTKSRSDVVFRSRCFRDQQTQRLCGVLKQSGAQRSLTIDKTPDRPFIDIEAPRGRGGAAKHLNAMRKVVTQILHCERPGHCHSNSSVALQLCHTDMRVNPRIVSKIRAAEQALEQAGGRAHFSNQSLMPSTIAIGITRDCITSQRTQRL
jgi:hypothetical protein